MVLTPLRRAAVALVALAALAGCARSLDQAECAQGDWRAIGLADGARGLGPERLEEHRAACARHGVAPDAAAWEAGRRAGLARYCTPRNAYRVGMAGRALSRQCPAAMTEELDRAWRQGRERRWIEREIAEIRSRMWGPGRFGPYDRHDYWGHDWIIDQSRLAGLRARLAALPPPPE